MKKLVTIIIISFIILTASSVVSNAAVEIKRGTTAYISVNISESFDICYNLRNNDSTLGSNNLDPHLATSLDWGAVAYLAQSRYGVNNSSINTNTTGNQSGVMNMNGYTQTATIFENRKKTSASAINYRYRLEEALEDGNLSKYVDVISNNVDSTTSIGRAMAETKNWYGASYSFDNSSNTDYPILIRDSLFGMPYNGTSGWSGADITFRPVIWN